jgi:hypothetical protein
VKNDGGRVAAVERIFEFHLRFVRHNLLFNIEAYEFLFQNDDTDESILRSHSVFPASGRKSSTSTVHMH